MKKKTAGGFWIALAVFVVLAVIAAGYYLIRKVALDQNAVTRPPAPPAAAATAPASPAESIQHPIGQAAPASAASSTAPAGAALSDEEVMRQLGAIGGDGLTALLRPEQWVARVVATIDALPRQGMNPRIWPLRPPQGTFAVTGAAGSLIADQAVNGRRYEPYLGVIERVDSRVWVDWYIKHYASFQQAYRDLGYPHGYFNDRLIEAIDDLLAAPEPTFSPGLEPFHGYYRYTDPAMESLSNGQKWLLRLPPAQSRLVRQRLRQIRSLLADHARGAGAD